MRRLLVVAVLLGLACDAQAFGRDPYAALAQQVTAAAVAAGARRAQFLPLVRADGAITAEGRMLSGRLLARLLGQKQLDVVLGPLPGSILEPYEALLSVADGREFNRRMSPLVPQPSDVAILGTYLPVGGRLKAELQVVAPATGRVLYAADADLPDEWRSLADLLPQGPRAAETSLLPEVRATPTIASAIVDNGAALRDAPAPLPGWATPAGLKSAPIPKATPVAFLFDAPQARQVELIGGFLIHSGGRLPLARTSDGRWAATVYLNPGRRYAYHFLVDGVRRLDPRNAQTRSGQSLLSVR